MYNNYARNEEYEEWRHNWLTSSVIDYTEG